MVKETTCSSNARNKESSMEKNKTTQSCCRYGLCAGILESPICLRNLEDNYTDFMNMHMIRNKNMDQSVLKKIGKQLMPFVALIATAMFKLEEKFYIVLYMISEWSLGPGYTPEYSVEKFHIVLKELMLQRIVGCLFL